MKILGFFLAALRLLAFVLVTSLFVAWYLLRSLIKGRDLPYILELRKIWMRCMFPVLGLRIHMSGNVPINPLLICSNHVSYIDPALILYHVKALAVAKIQVSGWPFIGYVADLSGTIFVDRDDSESTRKVRETMITYLKSSYSIINFPEGTTTDQTETIEFKPGGFKAAAKHDIAITPASLWYDNPHAPFIAEMKFLPHFFRCFSVWSTRAYIHYHPQVSSNDPKFLLEETKKRIDHGLQIILNEKMG